MPATALLPLEPALAFVGGDPALDLVNTVDWTAHGPVNERLPDYPALLAWGVAAGVVPAGAAERLRRRGAAHPREARDAHARALHARELLRAAFAADAAALPELNRLLADALGRLAVVPAGRGTRRLRWDWKGLESRLDAVLWPVLRSAAELLSSEEADRIRTCDGPACGWMYVDRSRNGFRRWCQMRTCGTREKSRRRRVGTG
jgi:predicted RNA-binding Zn ribbon-like protein